MDPINTEPAPQEHDGLCVRDIYAWIDARAAFDTMEGWDNSGLQTGDFERPVHGVLVTLDVTMAVVEEAARRGANVIIAHHPILFASARTMREDRPEGRLVAALHRAGISLISAHTNWDKAEGGVQDILADRLGIERLSPLTLGRIGWLPVVARLRDLAELVRDRLRVERYGGVAVRYYGDGDRRVWRAAVGSGSGMGTVEEAIEAGADVYITGDVRHHEALDALAAGICVIDAGHAATERPAMEVLRRGLQNDENVLKYKIPIWMSKAAVYGEAVPGDRSAGE